MKITIITPSFNQADFLEATIKSVLNQNYPQLEYLIFDGGSTDGTLKILKKYSHKLKWVSEPDRGQSHAINKGWKKATGEIIGYLNSDDLLQPDSLATIAKFFQKNPNAKWAYGGYRAIDEKSRHLKTYPTPKWNQEKFLCYDFIAQQSTFFRVEFAKKIGLFDEKQHLVMDYDYFLRAARLATPGQINKILSDFRLHQNAKSSQFVFRHLKETLQLVKKYSQPLSFLRLKQYFYYWRGNLAVILKYLHVFKN